MNSCADQSLHNLSERRAVACYVRFNGKPLSQNRCMVVSHCARDQDRVSFPGICSCYINSARDKSNPCSIDKESPAALYDLGVTCNDPHTRLCGRIRKTLNNPFQN